MTDLMKDLEYSLQVAWTNTFGQNQSVAYGKGKYKDNENPSTLVDSFPKDMAMVVLQPIQNAIGGAILTSVGIIQLAFNILAALMGLENHVYESVAIIMVGVATMLLAIVTPFARLYNASTRVYASAFGLEEKTENTLPSQNPEELFKEGLIAVQNRNGDGFVAGVQKRGQQLIDSMDPPIDVTEQYKNQLRGMGPDPDKGTGSPSFTTNK